MAHPISKIYASYPYNNSALDIDERQNQFGKFCKYKSQNVRYTNEDYKKCSYVVHVVLHLYVMCIFVIAWHGYFSTFSRDFENNFLFEKIFHKKSLVKIKHIFNNVILKVKQWASNKNKNSVIKK